MHDPEFLASLRVILLGAVGFVLGVLATYVAFIVYEWLNGDMDDRGLFPIVALASGTLVGLVRIFGHSRKPSP